jgi:hypothetical protein
MTTKEKGIRNEARSASSLVSEAEIRLSTERHGYTPVVSGNQADFIGGRRNSITLPRCCRGSHFTRFENLIGT